MEIIPLDNLPAEGCEVKPMTALYVRAENVDTHTSLWSLIELGASTVGADKSLPVQLFLQGFLPEQSLDPTKHQFSLHFGQSSQCVVVPVA